MMKSLGEYLSIKGGCGGGGGGGVQTFHFRKKDFELGVGGEARTRPDQNLN